jgi:hypothetical protein
VSASPPVRPSFIRPANALPRIVSHGWPGSVLEQMKIIVTPADWKLRQIGGSVRALLR